MGQTSLGEWLLLAALADAEDPLTSEDWLAAALPPRTRVRRHARNRHRHPLAEAATELRKSALVRCASVPDATDELWEITPEGRRALSSGMALTVPHRGDSIPT
jgi:hypothetical protein